MLSRINSTINAIWRKMKSKEYRDSFVSSNISNTVSAQIHTMRQVRGWTQSELALRCEMRQPRISALEDPDFDNVEISTLKRIAAAFDVALIVQFVPFSRVASLAASMKPSDFNVIEFAQDSLSKQPTTAQSLQSYVALISNILASSNTPMSIDVWQRPASNYTNLRPLVTPPSSRVLLQ